MFTRLVKGALFALVIGLPLPRAADAAVTTNFSDIWWNPLESGWGVNISQQADFLFVSFFVYGPDGQPFWYTAQLTLAGQGANGALIFSGDNYVTSGTRFDGPWDPTQKGIRRVGSASFTATSVIAGTLVYTVDGFTTTKSLVRQTLKTESLAGAYLGGVVTAQTCNNPAFNGNYVSGVTITVAPAGSNLQFVTVDVENGNRCVYAGAYVQDGQMGRSFGNYTCTAGDSGSYTLFEIQSSISGVMGRSAVASSAGGVSCNITGRFAAVRTL